MIAELIFVVYMTVHFCAWLAKVAFLSVWLPIKWSIKILVPLMVALGMWTLAASVLVLTATWRGTRTLTHRLLAAF